MLELERGGKVSALNAAVERSSGELLAFSDANAVWEPDALRRLVAALADPGVGYVCGQLRLTGDEGANQEGLYWRYEMAVRSLESRLAGVTAGNGAVNAVRRDAYIFLAPTRGQDISLPFEVSKRGWRAIYEPRGSRQRADGADPRGRVPPQAPDDGGGMGDAARHRDARARAATAPSMRSRSSPTACCATPRRYSTWSRSSQTWR